MIQQSGASAHSMRITALLTTEAVANAVIHGPADGEIGVEVHVRDGAVRVEVSDDGTGMPVLREVAPTAPGGRGVMLIDRLSRRWGVDRREDGKTVWFEVPL